MQLMFFLSGLFVWPSLVRRGWGTFLVRRVLRLGVPFLVGTYILMPLAFYPVYRRTAVDPAWSAFWSHWTALPGRTAVVFVVPISLRYWSGRPVPVRVQGTFLELDPQ